MAEAASLFLGVLPVVIEAVKSYQTVREKIRVFRHYSREVKRVQKEFRVREQMFLNECRLLLQLVVDERKTAAMIKDAHHELWKDEGLDVQLMWCLSGSYESCKDLIEIMLATVEEIENDLKCFDVISEQKTKVNITFHLASFTCHFCSVAFAIRLNRHARKNH
jgi:hypothetical protein